MLYIGLVAGVVAGNAAAHATGMDAFRTYVATLVLIGPAVAGARLLHVVLHWRIYRQSPGRIWKQSEGGYGMYGGLPLVLLLSVPLLAALRLPFAAFWDVGMVTILTGMIFARIGCLLNGCCSGRPSNVWFSLYLPNHLGVWERRIPSQCLESGWAAILLVFGILVWRWVPFPGALFLLCAAAYASGRLVLESLREPEPGAARFNIYHGISVAIIFLSVATLAVRWPK
jgi:phosphatidylglycerol:prolipoprotein diacylglycerol transferase